MVEEIVVLEEVSTIDNGNVPVTEGPISRFDRPREAREELIADPVITERVSIFENSVEEPIAEHEKPQEESYGVVPLDEQVEESVDEIRESPFGDIGVVNNAPTDDSVEKISAFENSNNQISEKESEVKFSEPIEDSFIVVEDNAITEHNSQDEYDDDSEDAEGYDSMTEDEEISSGDTYSNKRELNFGGDTYGENEM